MAANGYRENHENVEPEFVVVTSGDFEIPVEEDGTLLLSLIRAQLPGASGLWYWSNDKRRKKAIRFDRTTNRLFPPFGGWSDRSYNVAYSDILREGILGVRELERYEVATKLFQESVESISRFANYETYAASLAKKDEMLEEMKKENDKLKARLANANYAAPGSIAGKPCEKCQTMETEVKIKEIELAETRDYNSHLATQLAQSNDKINELSYKCQEFERMTNTKTKETDLAKAYVERLKKELELVSDSAGGLQLGKLDSVLAEEAKSLKKQLDDSKWRCGELESALSSKSHEAGALHDWKREAENNLHRLNVEHGACLIRREKLEATIHALHQFALLMKKEAENAKKRSGGFIGTERKFAEKFSKDEMAEILQRYENDLDTTRESLRKQADELENLKWKCSELEATLAVKDNEISFLTEESLNKEQTLINEIDTLKLELEAGKEDSVSEPELETAAVQGDTSPLSDDEESSFVEDISTAKEIYTDEDETDDV